MHPSTKNYLVTGANRGIGRALVAVYLSRPNSIVVAAVRDPSTDTSRSLTSLPKHETSKLIIVKLDSSSDSDAVAAVETLVCVDSISHLDVVVANAGIFEAPGPTDQLRIEDVRKHIDVNGIAPLLLFQATEGLMRKAEKQPKFVLVGAALASLTQMEHFATQPWVAYGASKTLANYFVRKMHFENDWLIAFTIHPGHVQTEMGNYGAKIFGLPEAPVRLEDSAKGLVERIDEATKEETSGRFVSFVKNETAPW